MELRGRRLLVCDCEKTMPLDGGKLAKACEAMGASGTLELNTQLCRAQLANYQNALMGGEPLLVACTQEAPLFTEVAAEEAPEADIAFVNIRETAGWAKGAPDASAKIAALLAAATVEAEPTPTVSYESEGVCLIYGKDEQAIEAAVQLKDRLDVTVLLAESDGVIPPRVMQVPIFRGRITHATGHLGAFSINVDGYAPAIPSSRLEMAFDLPRNGAASKCDIIIDLTGGTPLFNAHERRDGYLRPDPGNPAAVQKAVFEASALIGEFEKPRYIHYEADVCAHSRSRKTGCTRCIDLCPVGAVTSIGDIVQYDPHVCGGCGLCASACPTGAATYQYPAGTTTFERLRVLLEAYEEAGGKEPVLLLHDERHGAEMISMMARGGNGLPANVLPFLLNEVTSVGIDFFAAALGYGATQIAILIDPDKAHELEGLAGQMALAETVMEGLGYGGGRVHLLDEQDPDAVEAQLYALPKRKGAPAGRFLAMGGKRSRTMLALHHLHDAAPEPRDQIPLPQGAPFGAVRVDTAGCTLCLSCVSACPTGALVDNEDRPWLGFQEEACVQCGLCRNTCPEQVITLEPRLNFDNAAKATVELNAAEPFLCVRCGKPFGIKSSIERVAEQLAGKHHMFRDPTRIQQMMMCDECRVIAEFEVEDTPLKGPARPITRTTDDYLREREIEEARAKVRAEREEGEDKG